MTLVEVLDGSIDLVTARLELLGGLTKAQTELCQLEATLQTPVLLPGDTVQMRYQPMVLHSSKIQ